MLSAEANFNVGLVVREQIILGKFWRQTEEKKAEMLNTLTQTFNEIFSIQVKFESIQNPEHYMLTGGGALGDEDTIVLSKNSLMTFLHMYGCMLLKKGFVFSNTELLNSPVTWSHTIFCIASRSEYFSSLAKGLFFNKSVPFIQPLTDCTTREDVDAVYNARVAEIDASGNIELSAIAAETEVG